MIKIAKYILIFVASIQIVSCQDKQKNMIETFQWEEGTNAPLGYPAEVYMGGLEMPDGSYVSLFHGTIPGVEGWGDSGSGTSHGIKAIPNKLNVKYLSYAENQFYHIDCEIDQKKIIQLFKQPYKLRATTGNLRDYNFKKITTGFAPGGVVVVWVNGPGRTVEIGRYQAEKITVPLSEIVQLDPAEQQIFKEEEVKRVMKLTSVIPDEVQEKNKNKPIPFGLWDSYRIKFNWSPTFQIQEDGTMGDFGFNYYNGEDDEYLLENNFLNTETGNFTNKDWSKRNTQTVIPSAIGFDWLARNQVRYSGYIKFNEVEIFEAFEKLSGNNKENPLIINFKVNIPNNAIAVSLKSKDKEIFLVKHEKTKIFKIKE